MFTIVHQHVFHPNSILSALGHSNAMPFTCWCFNPFSFIMEFCDGCC